MIDWIGIITGFLMPMLIKCWTNGESSAINPQQYLKDNFDETTGKMSRSVVIRAIPTARRALHKARKKATREERKSMPRYDNHGLYKLTESKLIEAMFATEKQVVAAYAVAETLDDNF